jgi:D-3-phosphoglycerate dehydrogenase / 2-oxoglutarate reductase
LKQNPLDNRRGESSGAATTGADRLVVVTDHSFRDLAVEEAAARAHGAALHYAGLVGDKGTPEAVANAVADADVAMVGYAPITRAALERMAPAATVVRVGIGVDNVDLEAAQSLGMQVANVPDYGVDTVADHAATTLLALARRIPHYQSRIRNQGWCKPGDVGPIRGLRSTVVGLIGLGRIAQAVHRRLQPFGASFIAYDPLASDDTFARLGIERVGLDELAARAHAISLHAPSTPDTVKMINREFLSLVNPGTILVNTARGALVDHDALVDALGAGQLAGAALDVTDPEPLPAEHILRSLEGVVLTPHAAFYDEDSLRALQKLASEEVGRALRGEPLRCRVA